MFRRTLTLLSMFLFLFVLTVLHAPIVEAQATDTGATVNDDETQTEENADNNEGGDTDADTTSQLNRGQQIKGRCAGLTGQERSECVRSVPLLRPRVRSGVQMVRPRDLTTEGAVKEQCGTLDRESLDYRECVRRTRTNMHTRIRTLPSGGVNANGIGLEQGRERPARRIESRDFFRFKNNTIQHLRSRDFER